MSEIQGGYTGSGRGPYLDDEEVLRELRLLRLDAEVNVAEQDGLAEALVLDDIDGVQALVIGQHLHARGDLLFDASSTAEEERTRSVTKKRKREKRTERRRNALEQQREELGVEEFDDFRLLLRLPADIVGAEGFPQRVVLAYGSVVDFGEQVRLQREERLVAGGARSSGDPRLEEVHILFVRFPHPVN
jgi:hypothetical protein